MTGSKAQTQLSQPCLPAHSCRIPCPGPQPGPSTPSGGGLGSVAMRGHHTVVLIGCYSTGSAVRPRFRSWGVLGGTVLGLSGLQFPPCKVRLHNAAPPPGSREDAQSGRQLLEAGSQLLEPPATQQPLSLSLNGETRHAWAYPGVSTRTPVWWQVGPAHS